MKKAFIRSATAVAVMSILAACGESETSQPVDLTNVTIPTVLTAEEIAAAAAEDAAEAAEAIFSDVTVPSLKSFTTDLHIGVAVPFGSSFSNGIENRPEIKTIIETHFNQLSAENIMKQTYMQPTEGEFFWDDSKALVAYAKSKSLTVHGHVLVWHSQIADWMTNFEGDKAAWIDMMETHATTVAAEFEEAGDNDTVTSWDVVNEAFNENGTYRGSGEATSDNDPDISVWYSNIGEEFIPLAFKAARAADPDADLYYNDYNLIWNTDKLDAVIVMAQAMLDEAKMSGGVAPIDGIGFQSHITLNNPAISTIKAQFQKVVDLGLKVKITELDVRMNNPDEIGTKVTAFTSARADEQKEYYQNIVKVYLDVVPEAQRGGITVWGTVDGDSWLQGFPNPTVEWPLLFNDDFTAKPALQGFADALELAFGEAAEFVPDVPDVIVGTGENILTDGDFEGGLGGWGPRGDATVTLVTNEVHGGVNSALVEGRTANWQGISKDVVNVFTAEKTYNVSAWVKLSDDASAVKPSMKLTLEIKYDVDGSEKTDYLEMTAPVTVAAGEWVKLSGTYMHTITTVANEANLYVEGSEIGVDFYVDDIFIEVAGSEDAAAAAALAAEEAAAAAVVAAAEAEAAAAEAAAEAAAAEAAAIAAAIAAGASEEEAAAAAEAEAAAAIAAAEAAAAALILADFEGTAPALSLMSWNPGEVTTTVVDGALNVVNGNYNAIPTIAVELPVDTSLSDYSAITVKFKALNEAANYKLTFLYVSDVALTGPAGDQEGLPATVGLNNLIGLQANGLAAVDQVVTVSFDLTNMDATALITALDGKTSLILGLGASAAPGTEYTIDDITLVEKED